MARSVSCAAFEQVFAPSPPRRMTRLQHGIVKTKKYTDGTVRYGNFCSTGEPENLEEALGDSRWKEAMQDEINALIRNQTWHLVKERKEQT
jgi:hypothetical protein